MVRDLYRLRGAKAPEAFPRPGPCFKRWFYFAAVAVPVSRSAIFFAIFPPFKLS
jgi:hypothetical protein